MKGLHMRPDARAKNLLSTTRAKAKMFEYRVPVSEHIALPQPPQLLFSLAVGLLGNAAASIASGETGSINPEEGAIETRFVSAPDLAFAATFFDSFVETHLEEELTQEFSILCASAYYLSGNAGSARVVASKTIQPEIELSGGLLAAAHSILMDNYSELSGQFRYASVVNPLLSFLGRFLLGESDAGAVIALCDKLRSETYEDGTSSQLLYSDIIAALCRHKLENASRTILPPTSGLPLAAWLPALLKPHFPSELWPAQKRICAAGMLVGKSAVIQMPTSAGKTRATELVIRSAFLAGRADLAVIVAPYRSLCHDIRGDLTKAFAGENINLDEASDSYQFDVSLEQLFERKSVLIVTPEKLLYMLRRAPELASRIGLIVYDEGHQFDGMTRGPTYELLLSSLKIALPSSVQVILISAVIGNAAQIAAWLINDPHAVVAGEGLLPTKKSIAFASWQDARGRLEYVSPMDPDEREFWVPRVIESVDLPALPRERKIRTFPESKGTEIGLYLGLHLVTNGSVAVFCGRKDSAAGLCKKIVELVDRGAGIPMPISSSDAAEITKIATLLTLNVGSGAYSTRAAQAGLLAHHASVPQGVRLAIEHAMKYGLARFVVCTSTLAQGVNFPIKYLIVTSVQQGQDRISVRDFHNLIGRAGRAGMHTEGSVIFSSPELYDDRSTLKGRWKWQQTKMLLDPSNAEPSASSILALFNPYQQTVPAIVIQINAEFLISLAFANRDGIGGVVAATLKATPTISERELRIFLNGRARAVQSITSYLLAHMSFGGGAEAITAEALAANTLAFYLADPTTKEQLKALFQGIAASIASNANTEELRAIIRRSPLSPASVSHIKNWLTTNQEQLNQAAATGGLLLAVYNVVSAELTANTALRSLSDYSLVPALLNLWTTGAPFYELLTLLAGLNIRHSGDHITIEDVVSICESAFGYDFAMIVSTMTDLTEIQAPELSKALGRLQKQIKYGLSTDSSIAFFENGFADRVVAHALGNAVPSLQYRSAVPSALTQNYAALQSVLSAFPAYYSAVLEERRSISG
jgi:superfamily II DNA/RNA helicase